ncbi:PAS domain S-box-containing protein/diguanylate cyclase (GGDEF) domain-containing protein [Andreprevotia lacus DSM 23236]|jgi:diguanylate cyclase (GGDEF)-like protein/PAS domain S-box-containing protein|uniref:PAS domain S-box-containing protein/diguanylate cyclase (GGDEF) domain-containing protein n=1 Tax=Andreprevotia lacus DSM 23236 TaxID=1121001 RepID=A0A1W1XPG4_9NEIS|nr:diguanylate cyclase [Andreprevotia lacus]SMC25880.1 PAS domain S-box-containing protein/diguanylate cyclase (GGDEF) domain-containing protein [Andreprevotia lacus DSM 23236]
MTDQALLDEVLGLRTILENVGAYIYTKDLDGRYTYVNSLVCQLFGRTLAEIVGQTDEAFFDLHLSDELRRNDRFVLESGQTITREEHNVVRETGDTRIYWTVKTPVRNAQGVIVGMCGISTDITERKALERALAEQKQLLDTVLNNADANIYMKSLDRRFLYVNSQCASLLARPVEEITGKRDIELLPAEVADHFWEMDRKAFETHARQAGEESYTAPDGRTLHYWSIKVPLDHLGYPDRLIGFSSEITELYQLKEELRRQANTDALTSTSSRRHFIEQALHQVEQARRYQQPLSLLALDLDHFKRVNDRYGHAGGDAVLVAVAGFFRRTVRTADLIGRLGGEEFAILLPNTDAAAAYALAGRLCSGLSELDITLPGPQLHHQKTSIGVATLGEHDTGFEALLARADRALYAAKHAGRNRVRRAD